MTSLDAKALDEDPEGLAFLRDVLKTATPRATASPAPESVPAPRPLSRPVPRALPASAARRTGLIGATALAALLVAVSPVKPATPEPQAAIAAAPAKASRPATKVAALSMEPTSCPRVRKRLWVEGEGWVVRSVAKCW